jgi:hypothetical protein
MAAFTQRSSGPRVLTASEPPATGLPHSSTVIPTWASSTLAAAIAGIAEHRCALPSRLARRTDVLPIGQRGRQDRPRHHQRLTRLAYVPAKEDGKIYARARRSIRIFRQAISRRGPDANGIFSQDARPGAASGGALTYLNWAFSGGALANSL